MILRKGAGRASLIKEGVCQLQIYVACILHIYVVAGRVSGDVLFPRLPNIMINTCARSMHAGAAEISPRVTEVARPTTA